MLKTMDGQSVYPAGASLPEGARGFCNVRLESASYVAWYSPADLPQVRADREMIKRLAATFVTKQAMRDHLLKHGVAYPADTLADMRVQFENRMLLVLWPWRQHG